MSKKSLNNKNLSKAKNAKDDEFYTQYKDIEKELKHYKQYFINKVVYCNCDNPQISNFFKFFALNFDTLQLKKIIATYFDKDNKVHCYEITKQVTAQDDNIDLSQIKTRVLKGNGSFDSSECKELLRTADIIVTNPPYSLFRDFIDYMFKYSKKFLIIGNANAITYKNCFSYIQQNKMWLGVNCVRWFYRPHGELCEGARSFWFTNLDVDKRHQKIDLTKEYSDEYVEYDNYNAIEVSKAVNIPRNYKGIMGVPITFLSKYNPEQFRIIGSDFQVKDGLLPELVKNNWDSKIDRGYINGKRCYSRIFIQHQGV